MVRKSSVKRKSNETDIKIDLRICGKGKSKINTQINFLNHVLEGFSKHGGFDLNLDAKGDLHIDQHHLLEDLGMLLGKAFKKALKEKRGINRAGFFAFPMDESLSLVSIDLSGRPYLVFKSKFKRKTCGDLELDNLKEFFSGFSMGLGCNISILTPYGENDHHKLESIFKAFGKAMQMACSINKRLKYYIPSTKGILDNF